MIPGFKLKHRCRNNTQGANLINICENDTNQFVADGSEYDKLLQKCIAKDKPLSDKKFPANSESMLGFGPKADTADGMVESFTGIEWMTSGGLQKSNQLKLDDEELGKPNPFCTGGIKTGDIRQGGDGDCFLLSGLSSVTGIPDLVEQVFVTREISKYAIYCVALFLNGAWESVVLDSRFPVNITPEGVYNMWCCATNKDENGIWVMLLEKAYAKVHGGY